MIVCFSLQSLDNLYKLIDRAEERNKGKKSYHRDRHRKPETSHSRAFMKPSEDDETNPHFSYESYRRKGSQGFRKPKPTESSEKNEKAFEKPPELPEKKVNTKPAEDLLTDQEMNSLASKILKAEIMGNTVSQIHFI